MSRRTRWLLCLPWLAGLWLASGCAPQQAARPWDAKMAEQAEIQLGKDAHPDVIDQYGRYDDDVLQGYVQRIGEQLAAVSPRGDLIFRFTVLDTDEVNSFALPGGYVYVSRGLIAYLTSEAQLAAVLAHEIGHVVSRHSVRQLSNARSSASVFTIGSVFVPELRSQAARDVFTFSGDALSDGYSAAWESEADRAAAQMLAHSGYDPRALLQVREVLQQQAAVERQIADQQKRQARVHHRVAGTPGASLVPLEEAVAAVQPTAQNPTVVIDDERLFHALDGLVWGDSGDEGIRRDNVVYNEPLGFVATYPDGWQVLTHRDHVTAFAPTLDAVVQMSVHERDLDNPMTPKAFMANTLKLDVQGEGQVHTANNLEGYTATARVRTPFGYRNARCSVLYLGERALAFVAATKNETAQQTYAAAMTAIVDSFRPLRVEERELATPRRIKVIVAAKDATFAELAKNSVLDSGAEVQLRLLNQRYPAGEPEAGQKLKIVQ